VTDILPAVISGAVALVISTIGIFIASKQQNRQFANEIEQAGKRFQNELTLQEERLKVELRTTFMAEEAIHELLLDESFRRGRSFDQIKRNVGGFEDDELRKLLVRSGAIRYYRRGDNKEMWGLRSRVLERAQNSEPPPETEKP
jgi:hypothetical protein